MRNSASSPTLINVAFNGNHSDKHGGGMYNTFDSSPTIINGVFNGNSAVKHGGAMRNYRSTPTFINVTFVGNTALGRGGALFSRTSSLPHLTNSIFWGNTDETGANDLFNHASSSNPVINYTAAQTILAGTKNIHLTTSPFVGLPGSGEDGVWGTDNDVLPELIDCPVELALSSCWIDAGDEDANLGLDIDGDGSNDTISALPFDLLGYDRIVDRNADPKGLIDLGAYEAQ
jgi:predicted outer membrane repeat protein